MSNRTFVCAASLIFGIIFLGIVIASPKADDATIPDFASKTKQTSQTSHSKQKDDTKPIPDGPQPVIEFDHLKYDFGKQISGNDLKHFFSFKNTGKGMLIIEKVKAG